MSDDKLRAARKLIEKGRYNAARDILRSLDDPVARQWLERLETAKPKRRRSLNWRLPIIVLALSVGTVILILSLQWLPQILRQYGQAVTIERFDDTAIDAADQQYLDLMHYCTLTVGYGVETCLDWVDDVIAHYQPEVTYCLSKFKVETVEDRAEFGGCLADHAVPWVFDPPPE